MQKIKLISQLLQLDSDWHIVSIDIDEPSNRIDINIHHGAKRKRKFFARATDQQEEQNIILLRHLPFAGMRTYLHVLNSNTVDSNKMWAPAGSRFTNEMEALIVEALHSCRTIQAVAKLTHLTSAEVRGVSERTGVIPEYYEESAPVATLAKFEHAATRSFELDHVANLPAETSDVWQRLIDGEIPVQFNSVALKMLMHKVKQNMQTDPSEVTQLSNIKLLRQYFIKNQSQHQAEIKMLSGGPAPIIATQTPPPPPPKLTTSISGLPSENEFCWQRIISGSLRVETSRIGLQMMMERVRISVENDSSETARTAGIKILHQFFTKHQSRLQPEIEQLGNTATREPALAVPNILAPVWKELITGQKSINTHTIGLQMMIERVGISVERHPSEASRTASIKILHQFFTKHQSRLQSEIQQLGGTISTKLQALSVPADTHPSWQWLINGELKIKTDVVALKMMLERIRISIENDPSDASRMAGAKILRRYFLKHQSKHQVELGQLLTG